MKDVFNCLKKIQNETKKVVKENLGLIAAQGYYKETEFKVNFNVGVLAPYSDVEIKILVKGKTIYSLEINEDKEEDLSLQIGSSGITTRYSYSKLFKQGKHSLDIREKSVYAIRGLYKYLLDCFEDIDLNIDFVSVELDYDSRDGLGVYSFKETVDNTYEIYIK